MTSARNLARMTKAELAEKLQSAQAAAAQAAYALHQQTRLLDLAYHPIIVWELGGTIRYWNQAAIELYGWTREEALEQFSNELLKLIHPKGWAQVEEALLRDGHWYGELIHQTRDGRRVVVNSRLVLVREDGGQQLVLEINRDLTASKQVEERWRESQTRLEMLFQHTQDAILFADDQSRYIDANPSACKLTGFTREELLQKTVWELTPLPERERGTRLWREFIQSGTQSGEYELLCKDGSMRTVEFRAVANIQPGLHLSILSDITERKRAEVSLRESEERLSLALNAAAMGIWSWEISTNRVFWSPESYKLIDVNHHDPTLESFKSLVHPEDLARLMESVDKAIASHTLYEAEFRIIRSDGQIRWLSNLGRAMYDPAGQPQRMLGVVQDITGRKEVFAELTTLKDQLAKDLAEMNRLHELSVRLLEAAELQEVLEEILNAVISIQQADFGNIQLYDPATQALKDCRATGL